MNDKLKKRCHRIADTYGKEQIFQLIEELAELIAALNHFRRTRKNKPLKPKEIDAPYTNVVEELADVCIMSEQIKHLLDISDYELHGMIDYKIGRTEKRIQEWKKEMKEAGER